MVTTDETVTETDNASMEEIEQALERLCASPEAIGYLLAYAYKKIEKNKLYKPRDLLNEAIARVLEGRRNWPRRMKFDAFIIGVMRSVGSEFNEESDERARDRKLAPTDDPEEGSRELVVASKQPRQDRELHAKRIYEEIWKLFEDDEEAQTILMGREEGMDAAAIKETFSLTDTKYDTATKRIWRALKKHYPKGWDV